MEEDVFTISITVSQQAAKIDGTTEIVDDYGLGIVATQQGVALEGVTMSEISQTALIAFGQWYKGDPGQDGQDGVDGFSPVVTVTPTENGHEVTITDASGDHTFDVNDGVGVPQTLSLDGNELTLSDGGGTVALPDGLPSQTGNAGKFLTTDGTDASWEEVPEQVNADWEATSGPSEILHKPTLGTASELDVAESGNASTTQVVKGNDTRLSDSRNAADVFPWAKANTKPSYTASEVGAIASSEKGSNNGVAELDATGKVPSSQLPSYVDDVLEYASLSALPATGDSGKIYVALDTNKTYRWSGSSYVEISESLALGETSTTAYAGNKGKANADAIAAIKDGTSIDSFGDVETALGNKQDTIDSSHKLNADYIEEGTTNKVINVKPDWNAASGSTAEILNKPTIPDVVSGQNDGTNWTAITIGSSTFGVPSIPSNISAFTNDAGYVPKSNIVGIGFADTNKILVSDDVAFTSYGASDYSTNFILICGKQVTLNSSSTRKFYRLNGAYTNYTFENNLTISTGVYKAVLSDGVFALTTIPDTYSVNSLINTAISQIQTGVPEIHSNDAGKVMTVNSNEDGYELVNPNSLCSIALLSDVTVGLLSNGNILQWDSSSSKWVNGPAPTGTIPSPTTSNTYLYSPDGTNFGWTTIGSITGHDLTHIANTTVSTSSTTITFAADIRGSQMITVSDDIDIAFVVNNNSDNYLWIENSGSTNNIDVTISSVTHNGNIVSSVRMPRDGIAVPAGGTCEISIVCNADGAFITSRDDLE